MPKRTPEPLRVWTAFAIPAERGRSRPASSPRCSDRRAGYSAGRCASLDYGARTEGLCTVDTWATITTIWQAEGVLMEILDVDATDALLWLTSIAGRRGVSLADLSAEVVEHRTI